MFLLTISLMMAVMSGRPGPGAPESCSLRLARLKDGGGGGSLRDSARLRSPPARPPRQRQEEEEEAEEEEEGRAALGLTGRRDPKRTRRRRNV